MRKLLFFAALCLLLTGCDGHGGRDGAVSVALLYKDLLPLDGGSMDDESTIAAVRRVGEAGYPVTDAENRLLFENADAVLDAYEDICRSDEGELSIVELCLDGGLLKTDIVCRSDGEDTVTQTRVTVRSGEAEVSYRNEYALLELKVTEKGYLIYTCDISNTTESVHGGYIQPTVMLRLYMPDAQCAAYAAQIDPAGYLPGGLFSSDWDSDDVSRLDADTVFMSLYKLQNGGYFSYYNSPYAMEDGSCTVPGEEMTALTERYLPGAGELFRGLFAYDGSRGAYLVDAFSAAVPTSDSFLPEPDVTGYCVNADGTVTLYVDAAFERYATDCAFRHVLTVAPLEGGGYGYISNRVLKSDDNIFPQAFYGLAAA